MLPKRVIIRPDRIDEGIIPWENGGINLSYDGGFTDLSYDEGGLKVPPPFLFVKTIEKVIRLCTVLKKKLFDWQF